MVPKYSQSGPEQRNELEARGRAAALNYVIATNLPIGGVHRDEINQRNLDALNNSVLGLVRAANDIARQEPDPEEFEALRWVLVARKLVGQVVKVMPPGTGGEEKIRLFSEIDIETQTELYEEAVGGVE